MRQSRDWKGSHARKLIEVHPAEHVRKEDEDLFFFFQAEDGIRDVAVTGVQTCALPISRAPARGGPRLRPPSGRAPRTSRPRSEERRVGKECRSRWSPHHEKKK